MQCNHCVGTILQETHTWEIMSHAWTELTSFVSLRPYWLAAESKRFLLLPPTLNERLVQNGEAKGSMQSVHKVNGNVLITILLLFFLFGCLGLCSLHIHSFNSHKGFVVGFFLFGKSLTPRRGQTCH